jgi:hypothetical protein
MFKNYTEITNIALDIAIDKQTHHTQCNFFQYLLHPLSNDTFHTLYIIIYGTQLEFECGYIQYYTIIKYSTMLREYC